MITVPEFKKRKQLKQKLSMITCYDSSFARLIADSPIDLVLVGDSSAMVMQGHDSTIHASIGSMAFFTANVARGLSGKKFLIGDMPFLSTRKGLKTGMNAAHALIKAGAHAVKIEGIDGNEKLVHHLTESGIPVMGHLGLTPQFVNAFGGMKVQAKTDETQKKLLKDAKKFQELGAMSLVLECVPATIATLISNELTIPTIGIGAGPGTDGQVLVLQDLLGMNAAFKPKFLRNYFNGAEAFKEAFLNFHMDVKNGDFPNDQESY